VAFYSQTVGEMRTFLIFTYALKEINFLVSGFLKKTRMNKQELVASMAEKSGLTKADSEKALNAFVKSVSESLSKKQSVQLVGFGTFSVSERSARTGRNPQTGKAIKIAAKNVAKFKAGKALDEQVN
jgi:DNA-binding protein HU-beta